DGVDVGLEAGGDARGVFARRVGRGANLFSLFVPFFDFADAAEVLVELLPVASGELALQRAGVLEDEIKYGALLLLAALEAFPPFAGRAGAEEAFEEEPGIGLRRHGLGGRAPREVVLVGAGITGIAIAGFPNGV